MSLLTIIEDACSELGLRKPSAVVGSQDLTAQILLQIANQSLKHLYRYHDWQALIVDHTFTSVNQALQTGAIPSDFGRLAHDVEVWNRSLNQRYVGPTPQRFWQQLQSSVAGGVTGWWRLMGNELHIFPAPAAGQTIAFEYISKHLVMNAVGDTQEKFEADTDEALIPEDLITLEVIWRYRKSRGYAQYAEDMATAEREKEKAASHDRGSGRIRPTSVDLENNWPPVPFWDGTIEN